jgi:hypothetical protein
LNIKPNNFRLPLGDTKVRELLAQESQENPRGKRAFHLGLFLGFPRMLRIRVGRFQRPGQKQNGGKLDIPFKQQREASCLDTPSNIRK